MSVFIDNFLKRFKKKRISKSQMFKVDDTWYNKKYYNEVEGQAFILLYGLPMSLALWASMPSECKVKFIERKGN